MRTQILGVGFDAVTMEEAAARVLALANSGRGYVCTPNPEIVMLCRENEALRGAVAGADLVVPDGIGVVRASRTLGRPLPERVPGIDLFLAVLDGLEGGLYLLGGRPGRAEEAAAALTAAHPGLRIAGTSDGYFADEAAVVRDIREKAPALTAVCLGSPKQELFMAAHREELPGVMMGLGGALDVLSGRAERAPEAWRQKGLEWLWRLLKEPRRIRRMIRLPAFALAVRKQRKQEWKKED